MKSGATIAPDFVAHLLEFRTRLADHYSHLAAELRLVYGGSAAQTRPGIQVLPWSQVQEVDW